ncbi:MAG: TIGR03087 family PEP-CTERM/XrtA system glycosyltransferase [Sphingomonadales bacterium]|nr:TIGR03087 family PEP-CTERM/XrtA system glycosyltransferase [Sphingomonadales bacterium]
MQDVLFISHRIPFPPDRGDKIRSHNLLRHIATLAPVHVATFADDDDDMAYEAELADLAASYRLVRRAKPLVLAGMQALASRQPVSLTAFHDAGLAAYVAEVLATRPIGTIFVFSGQMGQYVPADFAGRLVVDFVDVDSAKFEAYARRGQPVMRWIDAREGRMLRAEEGRIAARADVSLLASTEEAALFTARLPAADRAHRDVRALGNGIDSVFFDPAPVTPEPRMAMLGAPRLIFTGQMDYAPNIDAAVRVADRIMPLVRAHLPEATFHVVGRRPVDEVKARDGVNGTHVWGRVDDIRPWLKAADMAVVPLEIARGIQNKVLEAMAMALPVVVTREAATGIDAVDGRHFTIAGSDQAFADAIVTAMQSPNDARAMGVAARRFVVEHQSWQGVLAQLPGIMSPQAERSQLDAA